MLQIMLSNIGWHDPAFVLVYFLSCDMTENYCKINNKVHMIFYAKAPNVDHSMLHFLLTISDE